MYRKIDASKGLASTVTYSRLPVHPSEEVGACATERLLVISECYSWFLHRHGEEAARQLRNFVASLIEVTGPNRMRIHGKLDLRGMTRTVILEATFNGGYEGHALEPHARIGFSAHGSLQRSKFGMGTGVPPPGSTMGVSDEVEVIIESEFVGPPWAGAG